MARLINFDEENKPSHPDVAGSTLDMLSLVEAPTEDPMPQFFDLDEAHAPPDPIVTGATLEMLSLVDAPRVFPDGERTLKELLGGTTPEDQESTTEMSIAGSNSARPSHAQSGVFPFFDLPRELRNQIYQQLKFDIDFASASDKFLTQYCSIKACSACHPMLLQISRQFKAEYEDEISATSYLSVVPVRALTIASIPASHQQLVWFRDGPKVYRNSSVVRIERLVLLVWQDRRSIPSALKTAELICPWLQVFFPAIRRLEIEFNLRLKSMYEYLAKSNGDPGYLGDLLHFTIPPLQIPQRDDIIEHVPPLLTQVLPVVETKLLLRAQLCTIRSIGFDSKYLKIRDKVERDTENEIVYHATASACTYDWYGLHLETFRVGDFDLDQVVGKYARQAERKIEKAALGIVNVRRLLGEDCGERKGEGVLIDFS